MEPKIYSVDDSSINHQLIDPDAVFIVNKLRDAGFTAYLVGGCIRDLLKGKRPKDFDISTSAEPSEIKKIFRRNCLLIGRRFRLAHIRFGKKVFEVSTFRKGNISDSDLITRDNEWGSPEEDAVRRDFTINGLFYEPLHRTVIDYVGGWEDIQVDTLRSIGKPEIRFKQDPVRMIRLLKFVARFDFLVDPSCLDALEKCRGEIIKSAPARILEELFRMLESGFACKFFHLMSEHKLLEQIFPELDQFLKGGHGEVVYHYLDIVDRIHERNTNITLERSLLVSSLLFPILEKEIEETFLRQDKMPNIGEVMLTTWSIIKKTLVSSFSHFPKRISSQTAYILSTQYKLTPLNKKKVNRQKMAKDKQFHMALRFLKIRAIYDEQHLKAYYQWEETYKVHHQHGERHPRSHSRKPVHRRSYRKNAKNR